MRNRIGRLKNSTGPCTSDPVEMADLLGAFFESTFITEPVGEVPSLDHSRIAEEIGNLTIDREDVKNSWNG